MALKQWNQFDSILSSGNVSFAQLIGSVFGRFHFDGGNVKKL